MRVLTLTREQKGKQGIKIKNEYRMKLKLIVTKMASIYLENIVFPDKYL